MSLSLYQNFLIFFKTGVFDAHKSIKLFSIILETVSSHYTTPVLPVFKHASCAIQLFHWFFFLAIAYIFWKSIISCSSLFLFYRCDNFFISFLLCLSRYKFFILIYSSVSSFSTFHVFNLFSSFHTTCFHQVVIILWSLSIPTNDQY